MESYEENAIQTLLYMSVESIPFTESVVALVWVQDGINETESGAMKNLQFIAHDSPKAAFQLVSLNWAMDDIDMVESEAIDGLANFAEGSASVVDSLVLLAWLQDGVTAVESRLIENLSYVAYDNPEAAVSVVAFGWLQDDIDSVEGEAIDSLANFTAEGVLVVDSLVSLGWMQDGVTAMESQLVENLSYIAFDSPEAAQSVLALDWMQDDINAVENEAIDWLSNFTAESTPALVALASLPWMLNDVNNTEVDAIKYLSYMAFRNADAAHRTVVMPFMKTIELSDVAALDSLRRLARNDSTLLEQVLNRMERAGGITDGQVPVVATFAGVLRTNPAVLDRLLDPSALLVEQRSITLPLAREVQLVIIRTRPGAVRSMDLLEHAVRNAEEFMDAPFPTNIVTLLYEDAVLTGYAGTHFGTNMTILPEYDVDDGSHEAETAGATIAHEVAHYYWSGNKSWIDEGASELVGSFSETKRAGSRLGITNSPCPFVRTIAELESLSVSTADPEYICSYSLGERIFVDLYQTLGNEEFRESFRALYLTSKVENDVGGTSDTEIGIEQVRAAFLDTNNTATHVVARWYDGSVPYDLSQLDSSPVDPSLPGINGRIDAAHVSFGPVKPQVTEFSSQAASVWLLLVLKISYQVWSLNEEVHLDIVEFYEDGTEFRRRSVTVTAGASYIGSTYSFSVGTAPSKGWAVGRYFVYVYDGDRKVAEVQYNVTP